jgi:hypothetical protein
MMTIQEWRAAVRECIRLFADADRQDRAWRGRTPEMPDWIELMCMLYDDVDASGYLGKLLGSDNVASSSEEATRLQAFLNAVEHFSGNTADTVSSNNILQKHEWLTIRKLATEYLSAPPASIPVD